MANLGSLAFIKTEAFFYKKSGNNFTDRSMKHDMMMMMVAEDRKECMKAINETNSISAPLYMYLYIQSRSNTH